MNIQNTLDDGYDYNLPSDVEVYGNIFNQDRDILASSCAWYRLRNVRKQDGFDFTRYQFNIKNLNDPNLPFYVNNDDRKLSEDIKLYYSQKLVFMQLKDKQLSPYRVDLNHFLRGELTLMKQSVFGLAYNLPKFYFYDCKIDKVFENSNCSNLRPIKDRETKSLSFLECTVKDNRTMVRKKEYWFADSIHNCIVNISLDDKNPLINLWEKIIQHPINLDAKYKIKQKDHLHYYEADAYVLQ